MWLINVHNGIPGKLKRIDINEYPSLKEHFDGFGEKLIKRADQGDTPYNLRPCIYLDDFCKQKIVYADIAAQIGFAISHKGEFLGNTAYFITFIDNAEEGEIQYLTNVLNSKLLRWYYRHISVQLGSQAARMFTIYMVKMPVPDYDLSRYPERKLLAESFGDEQKINNMVYNLFSLTKNEIDYIDEISVS